MLIVVLIHAKGDALMPSITATILAVALTSIAVVANACESGSEFYTALRVCNREKRRQFTACCLILAAVAAGGSFAVTAFTAGGIAYRYIQGMQGRKDFAK